MLETVFTAVVGVVFAGTGRVPFSLFGCKEPGDSPTFLAGFAIYRPQNQKTRSYRSQLMRWIHRSQSPNL